MPHPDHLATAECPCDWCKEQGTNLWARINAANLADIATDDLETPMISLVDLIAIFADDEGIPYLDMLARMENRHYRDTPLVCAYATAIESSTQLPDVAEALRRLELEDYHQD